MNEETNMLLFEMPQRSLLTVSLCMQEFCKTQILGRDDLVLCTSCNNRTWSIMSYEFEAVNSPFIMVQMKRFQRLGDRHSKVLSRVHLERVLRIGTERPSYYRLAAIQCHIGDSLRMGHYVTVLILPSGDVLLCDDFSVKKKPDSFIEQKMVQESCYLIYYEQLTMMLKTHFWEA
ncbi:uncharacterized protein LOC127843192 isoform X2 [Dreissena polymorpha]|uniref:uncharacterized protein LOC127843192 isoform X2 n=1 Tax=Dreissena polymorpha TaxID=45954 RepID=UPI0022645460|nr:uncharacterized protein LOC127843192 isoform X2 [Dreissena polymorpha]